MTFSTILDYLKKNYVVAISGFIAALCLGVYFLRNDKITRLAADYDDLSVRRSRILKNLKFATDIEADLSLIKEQVADAETRLFNPEDLATNQRYFYQIESSTGVQMSSIQQLIKQLPTGKEAKKAKKKAQQSQFQEIAYELEIQGEYKGILAFLRELEGGKAFVVVDGFSMVAAKGSTSSSEVAMRLSVSVLGRKS